MRWSPVVACAALLACIERPETPRSRAASVDRSSLTDVLFTAAPTPAYPVGATFGDAVELVGYDLSPDPAPHGAVATVTFWWRVLAPLDEDWKVFVHLEDEGHQQTRIIGDHWPAEDRFHTFAWRAGDVVKDVWRFTAPAGPSEQLALWTGLYRGDTRLPLTRPGKGVNDGQNRVRAGAVPLR